MDSRGNEPSLKFRYLQVRMDKDVTDDLYYLYPTFSEIFDDYEKKISSIAEWIYKKYVERYINHNYVAVPKDEFVIMKKCHEWHLENRTNNRISIRKVLEITNQQNATTLNRMIRRIPTINDYSYTAK